MRGDNTPKMSWEEAPDTITPEDLSKILGIGIASARNIFDRTDFPKIPKSIIGNIGKADKEAARLYIQGISTKTQTKESLLSMIYLELKKLTKEGNKENDSILSGIIK